MRPETTRIFKDLLSLHGHVADARLGAEPATDAVSRPASTRKAPTQSLFESFLLLGGREPIDSRIVEVEAPAANDKHAPIEAHDQRVAHC